MQKKISNYFPRFGFLFFWILTLLAFQVLISSKSMGQIEKENLDFEPALGAYANSAGEVLYLGKSSSTFLFYMIGNLQVGVTPEGQDVLLTTDGDQLDIVRTQAGKVSSIIFRRGDSSEEFLKTELFQTRPVQLSNGAVNLECSLIEPIVPGPYPAVVFAHGSGANSFIRYYYQRWYLAANGIASLACDKRGSGASSGDLFLAGYDDLAGDLLVAVDYMHTLDNIDPDRVGIMGISQAGWVMPIAAAGNPQINFVISLSGAGVSLAQQEHYLTANNLRFGGLGDRAVGITNKTIRFINSGMRTLQAAPEMISSLISRLDKFFDPIPVWGQLSQPVLAVYGEYDRHVPPKISAMRLKGVFEKTGNSLSQVLIFPKSNHGVMVAETGYSAEPSPAKRIFPYFPYVVEWINNGYQNDLGNLVPDTRLLNYEDLPVEEIADPNAPLFGSFGFQALLLILFVLGFLLTLFFWPLGYLFKRFVSKKNKGHCAATGRLLLGGANFLNLVAFFFLGSVITQLIAFSADQAGSLSSMISYLTIVAAVSFITSGGAVFYVVRNWKKNGPSGSGPLQYGFATLTTALFIPFIAFWAIF